jgi:hypothetical protein
MHNIPTAEEFIIKLEVKEGFLLSNDTDELKVISKSYIEFAKMHVKLALEAAAETTFAINNEYGGYVRGGDDKESILNAYPETLIK